MFLEIYNENWLGRIRCWSSERYSYFHWFHYWSHDVTFNLYLCFSFMKLAETLWLCLIKRIMNLSWIWEQSKVYLKRNLVVLIEKWIFIWQLVPVLFRVFRPPGLKPIFKLSTQLWQLLNLGTGCTGCIYIYIYIYTIRVVRN